MCSFADLRQLRAAAALLLAGCLAGCFEEHPCTDEVCDGRDNDCDGRSDETFVDAFGAYTSTEHCGSCGVVCAEVFPSATTTVCDSSGTKPHCAIESCASGQQLAGSGACVPARPVLCLPCTLDEECAALAEQARCLPDAMGGGHCSTPCAAAADCPRGFRCTQVRGGARAQCVPRSGSCACDSATLGAEFACELEGETDQACVGVQRCLGDGLSACEAVLAESCNEMDDDCDGVVDETFRDAADRYVGPEHCGGCGRVCAPLGPHQVAECSADGKDEPSCERSCESGFVDVDGLAATGCECQLRGGSLPRVGADSDCDGQIDPTPELVFVSAAGSDDNAGTAASAPVRSLERGVQLASDLGRQLLVARGLYTGPLVLRAGTQLIGGYSPDFSEHDFELYPVLVEVPASLAGAPVLRCKDVRVPTRVEGLTLVASPGVAPGQGSTAVLLDGCGPEVELSNLTISAARGAPGRSGEDSSERLAAIGLSSLGQLGGVSGGVGGPGGLAEPGGCESVAAGGGGDKQCVSGSVRGGDGGDAKCAQLSCDNASSDGCGNAGCTDFTQSGVCDIEAALAEAVSNPAPEEGSGPAPGGAGAVTYDAPSNHGVCSFCDDNPSLLRAGADGGEGASGSDGESGAGCGGGLSLDVSGRATAPGGGSGADGSDGSGGGGGSAGAGFARIGSTSGTCDSVPGGAGGGGGSGGCGAPGAAGGGGGGGSIGILIKLPGGATAGPRLSALRVVAASGGDGGDGGIGASGGPGGSGGNGGESEFWCARSGGRGGDGGRGGSGGGGGGGCGGPSLGVYVADGGADPSAYVEALRAGVTVERAGAVGRGGRGGFSPGSSGESGTDGVALDLSAE